MLPRCIKLGDVEALTRIFTRADVCHYATLIGDTNPIHICDAAAVAAGFDRCVVHGVLVGAMFSNLMGMRLPGPNSIYLQQTFEFIAPVLVLEEVTATVQVKEFHARKGFVWLETIVTKKKKVENKEEVVVCIRGNALGMNKFVTFEGSSVWTFKR